MPPREASLLLKSCRKFAKTFFARGRGAIRLFGKDTRGIAAIEFAAVGVPLFMLTVGVMEIGLAFFVNRLLDNAALETGRLIRTGQIHQSSMDAAGFKTEVCERLTAFLCFPTRLTVDVRSYDQFSALDAMPPLFDEDGELEDEAFQVGSANSIVVARFIYRWPMFTSIIQTDAGDTGNMERYLFSTIVFRNEPFPW
ncbi:TadE/TadG family type IV pilus assembly protein [Roseibium sp.]|uniref:TadE/TadG family type IV pilus assembly protein n=1 Tax=Roseibium sp. TaxID=1936156 RepID=UPI003A985E6A